MRVRLAVWVGVDFLAFNLMSDGRRAHSATWTFGDNMNGLTGLSNKTFSPVETVELSLSVRHPQAARFYEGIGENGLTIDSTGLTDVIDLEGPDKINLLNVDGATEAEAIAFSFNKPGVLTGINFDGVKDESLEYFVLMSSNGVRVNFFDSFANTSIPGAVDAAIGSQISGQVVYLLETAQFDDEVQGLHIPFAAGQQFIVTYSELSRVSHPLYEAGNGARLQGITVEPVPEASTISMLLLPAILVSAVRRRSDRKSD